MSFLNFAFGANFFADSSERRLRNLFLLLSISQGTCLVFRRIDYCAYGFPAVRCLLGVASGGLGDVFFGWYTGHITVHRIRRISVLLRCG